MNVVLDTNVLISGIVFGGKPRTILELIVVEKKISGIISKFVLDELLGVLESKFKYSREQLNKVEELIKECFIIVNPKTVPKIIKDDPFDNQIIAIVNEINIGYIISGDNHLLKIKNYKKVPIVTPENFVTKILNKL